MSNGPGSMMFPLKLLASKGVEFGTVIDIGCADGSFFLMGKLEGLLRRATVFNVDLNELYEPSLRAIRQTIGGNYFIGAVSAEPGELEIAMGSHPYWASSRPSGDLYWDRIGGNRGEVRRVPAEPLDVLAERFQLKPPYLLKLDVQGAERDALAGATKTLAETEAIIVEADVADFAEIHDIITRHEFTLYDVTNLERLRDGTLGWFYPIYVSNRLSQVFPKSFWSANDTERIVKMQAERRAAILKFNQDALKRLAQRR